MSVTLVVASPSILDTQGLQPPASRTGLFSHLELTVANSAPAIIPDIEHPLPCADHDKLLPVNFVFSINSFKVYLEHSSIKSFRQAD
jgi:hypothetical protein